MPELPDLTVYLEALRDRIAGARLERIRLQSPFVLRSVTPPPERMAGRDVVGLRRLGKRIVVELEEERFLVIHLMVAGRLRWRPPGAAMPRRLGLAAFDFTAGSLLLTESGSRKRAALHLVEGEAALRRHDPGGREPLAATPEEFEETLRSENHTLKRALTDPRLLAGIGNAYSDEILHQARLSPLRLTAQLEPGEVRRLHEATVAVLRDWTDRLRRAAGSGFPEQVTAFRDGMAVHGRHGKPCPRCGGPVQRIVYAESQCNYCPGCQTGGRLLADRALSRLLRQDWPRTLEEMERRLRDAGPSG